MTDVDGGKFGARGISQFEIWSRNSANHIEDDALSSS